MAAQSQSLRTNAIKAKIDNSQNDSLCRMSLQKNVIRMAKVGTERI